MRIFYAAVEDDGLTSGNGSRVYASGKTSTIKGEDGRSRRLAFIGDSAWCVACESMGIIVGGAPVPLNRRLHDVVNGRRQAVGGDQVACKCATRPQVIALYGQKFRITVDSVGNGFSGASNPVAPEASASSLTPPMFDEQVRAAAPRMALEGYPYFIETADGRTHAGRIDASGHLPRIRTDSIDDYVVHWGDEALAKQRGT